jgi:pimeloyl-ACP methyl ester carboxylesterase
MENLRLKVAGRNIHCLKAGAGPPVVLVHGGASDSRDWLDTMTSLSGRYTFYAPDLPGFGQSDRDARGYYLPDFSDFLLGFIAELRLERPALVGHSFGGRVCLDAGLKSPDRVGRLVVVDSSGLGKMNWLGSFLFAFFWALRAVMGRRQPFPRFLAKEGVDYNNVSDATLRGLTTPTLIVWKRYDPYMPLRIARRAAGLIPGCKLAVIPGCGHAPNKADREEFDKVLVDFLDS